MANVKYSTLTAPTCGRFMKSNAFGRLIAGPVGSGKTVSCVMEMLRRSIEQSPGADGYRHTRFAVVRQTLKQLKDTVLKDCKQWLHGIGEYRVSENTFHIKFDKVRSEWIFIPLEDAEDQARLLSMQLTGAWCSEAIEMDIGVLAPISGRIGRYPSGADGAPTWFGMIADTNMPSEGSPWHKFMTEPPADWDIHIQPSGLSAAAENLPWLTQTEGTMKLPINDPRRIAQGRQYYKRFVDMYGLDSDWVKRYVKAEYGDDPSGSAVFRTSFTMAFHTVENTTVIPGYPLIIGQDFGRDPWSIICQVDHLGRLVVHEEVEGTDTGLEHHVSRSLRPTLLQEKYLGMKMAMVGDPAGIAKNNITEENCFDTLKRLGMSAYPAPTNLIDPRLRAVEQFLLRQVAGGPALMINRGKCPRLVRAMAGGYRYTRKKVDGQRKPKPDKNEFSHVADTLQYVCLVATGGMLQYIMTDLTPRRRQNLGSRPTAASWT